MNASISPIEQLLLELPELLNWSGPLFGDVCVKHRDAARCTRTRWQPGAETGRTNTGVDHGM